MFDTMLQYVHASISVLIKVICTLFTNFTDTTLQSYTEDVKTDQIKLVNLKTDKTDLDKGLWLLRCTNLTDNTGVILTI